MLAVAAVLMMIIGIPSMLVFFACMVEQKRFGDGVRRSRELLAGKWPALLGLLLAVNGILLGALVLIYAVIVLICALLVTLFADAYVSAAVLTEACMRLEAAALFVGSILVTGSGLRCSDRGLLSVRQKKGACGALGFHSPPILSM